MSFEAKPLEDGWLLNVFKAGVFELLSPLGLQEPELDGLIELQPPTPALDLAQMAISSSKA